MRWFISMIAVLSVAHCRPQNAQNTPGTTVELIPFPNGLHFPKWLPQVNHRLQYFGNHQYSPLSAPNNNFLSPITESRQNHFYPNENVYIRKGNIMAILMIPSQNNRGSESKMVILNKAVPVSALKIASQPVISSMKETVRLVDQTTPNKKESNENQPSLAPYRFHPLFHYLKNRNTIQKERIIKFRNEDKPSGDVTTLILKPVARSLAGPDGQAISTPLSKAILRQGTNVDILFEPEAVAIAGPGGIAHAESDLEISYEDL